MELVASKNIKQRLEDGVGKQRLTVGTAASPFGCCNFFDSCTDKIFSLYYNGQLDLLDWMGFDVTTDCYKSVEFINYVRPEQSQGSDTAGYISDPCATPNGIEFGSCKLTVEDFGRYGRTSPTRSIMKPENYCKTRPRYMLDGSMITSEALWDMMFTMDVMLNDIREDLVTGNATTTGQFDGLQRWVKTGYDCQALNSYVVNWNNNNMDGGAGITLNGSAAPSQFNIVDWLLDIHRQVKQRISWSPLLSNQNWQVGNTVIVAPGFIVRELLDYYTGWSVVPGRQYEEMNLDRLEARDFRISLNGGLFGHGQISLDGDTIPILQYDWGMINGPTRGDLYYLTGAVGSQRIWEGQHLSANTAIQTLSGIGAGGGVGDYFASDNGRVLGKIDTDEQCYHTKLWMHPRLFCYAPWAQARFQNVAAHTPLGPLSPNPADTSFYIDSSFEAAECP